MTFYSKFTVLALLIISLSGGMVFALFSLQGIAEKNTSNIHLSAWSLVQVELEYQKFCTELELYQQGKDNESELLLAYDIAWNRMDVFLHGSENADLRSRFGAQALIEKTYNLLRSHENIIDKMPPPDSEVMRSWSTELLSLQPAIHQLTISNFVEPSAQPKSVHQEVIYVAIVLLILALMTLCTIVMLFRETRRHWYLSHHDHLTGLMNRLRFQELLDRVCPASGSAADSYSLCLIDVMQFHEINNLFGHHSGDQLLKAIGSQLQQQLPVKTPIARVGSSEFAMLLTQNTAEAVLPNVLTALRPTLLEYDQAQRIRLCCGISHYPEHTLDAHELFQFADMALAEAKHERSTSIHFFTEAMQSSLARRRELATQLRINLAADSPDLFLCYQPIHALDDAAHLGIEVLLRWNDPVLGFIPPPEIIDIAEEHGLGEALGDWIFARAVQDMQQLDAETRQRLMISINLSQSLFTPVLLDKVKQFEQASGFAANQIILELTENITLADYNTSQELLALLREQQFLIALDDFGTGLSSLAYLKNLPVDFLKIDKSFIKNIDTEQQQLHFIWHIAELAHVLNLRVVVEGVETAAEFEAVKLLGIEKVQGYYFSKPLPLDALMVYLTQFFSQSKLSA
jgi:diguanylate cyclase (GGDEF)-like protein